MNLYVACLLLAMLAAGASRAADAPSPPPAPCAAPEHRQFDFWLGDWDVRGPAGKVVGRNRITPLHNGCVLFESWTSSNGNVTGTSFNLYDAERKQWHQTWVDSSGSLLELDGGLQGSRMVLASAPGATMNRITWELLPDGRVRQLWESSTDRGATWKTAFDGYYERRK
jgi:hypothetical protein